MSRAGQDQRNGSAEQSAPTQPEAAQRGGTRPPLRGAGAASPPVFVIEDARDFGKIPEKKLKNYAAKTRAQGGHLGLSHGPLARIFALIYRREYGRKSNAFAVYVSGAVFERLLVQVDDWCAQRDRPVFWKVVHGRHGLLVAGVPVCPR